MNKIEQGFADTTALLFGTRLEHLHDYSAWLQQDLVATILSFKSAITGSDVHVPQVDFFKPMKDNLVTANEALEFGKKSLTDTQVYSLNLSNASTMLKDIRITCCDWVFGEIIDVKKCVAYGPLQYGYKNAFCWWNKMIAYSCIIRTSEYLFGCSHVTDSSFCIKCYDSIKLNRCFEVSASQSCNACYFCHNCENLDDCMFCFNLRGKKYAIANIEIGKGNYLKVKQIIMKNIADELEKSKKLRFTIFNLSSSIS